MQANSPLSTVMAGLRSVVAAVEQHSEPGSGRLPSPQRRSRTTATFSVVIATAIRFVVGAARAARVRAVQFSIVRALAVGSV